MIKYDKQPYIEVKGFEKNHDWQGYEAIVNQINKEIKKQEKSKVVVAIDLYPGVLINELMLNLVNPMNPSLVIETDNQLFIDNQSVTNKIQDFMTDDRVFGVRCHYQLKDFIDEKKLIETQHTIEEATGLVIIIGVGAALVCKPDIHIYCDLARWEIQRRYRNGIIPNWKHDNFNDDALVKYKRGFFFEWRVADRYKKAHFEQLDFVLDTNLMDHPKMMSGEAFNSGLIQTTKRPFRVVPFFDPGVWGGQWMKEVCDLDRSMTNYAWCFDCVPEENSLLLKVGETILEVPSIDVVYANPRALLGEQVYARFGAEFPIRFDFLDTVGGQNLSLQVHPLTQYIQENFNMNYTQDESYYILDAKEGAHVYLGVREGVSKEAFFDDLKQAQEGLISFPADQYVNKIVAKKHDHFLIPAGTAHCSGSDAMVLEISSTPFIFTFKLWDWGRLGLDGKPRPIHLDHGYKNLQFDCDTKWVNEQLVNCIEVVDKGDGWVEERTGLHKREFIETRRHWFTKTVTHHTEGKVNVLNLVEGDEAIIESPTNDFEPMVVHYAETFIIPAHINTYTITPYGSSIGKRIGTLKAFVRT